MRGYLAFFVFLHHSTVWFFYLKTGVWTYPPSNLFNIFGPGSVGLFFAITAFLFTNKVLSPKRMSALEWCELYVSRVARLVPLYAFAGFLFFIAVVVLSQGRALEVPALALVRGAIQWLSFGYAPVRGIEVAIPDGYPSNFLASVTWSLPYEWFFYFSLPVLSLLNLKRPSLVFLAFGIVGGIALFKIDRSLQHQVYFVPGIVASFLLRFETIKACARHFASSIVVLICLGCVVANQGDMWGLSLDWILFTIAFVLIACGNDIFGALSFSAARMLGDISYSVYLLHGAFLFSLFRFVIGLPVSKSLSPTVFWLVVTAATPVLVALCYASFRIIESPAIAGGRWVARWLRRSQMPRSCVAPNAQPASEVQRTR